MKSFMILTALAALSAAAPAPQASPIPMPRVTFRLRADPANAEVKGLGFLDKKIGWYGGGEKTGDYRAFYDEEHKTVNSTDGGILWLRPTHGTPMYYVFNGDPFSDPTPALTIYNWQIRSEGGRQYLSNPSFMACGEGSKANKALYFGPAVPSRCTGNFGLEIVWDIKPGPDPTETVTATVTETETETKTSTETCITTEEPTTTTELPDCPTETPTETETETDCPDTTTRTTASVPTSEPPVTDTTTSWTPIPTGTGTPLPPPGTNTTVTNPPVPTETDEPPVSAAGLKQPAGILALVIAAGMAIFVL